MSTNLSGSSATSLLNLKGLQDSSSEWIVSNPVPTAGAALLAALVVYWSLPSKRSEKDIVKVGRIPLLTAWSFFSKRYDFVMSTFRRTGERAFQFKVLNHQVVALSGEEGRKVFFNDKSLDFTEGYKILMGGAPTLDEISVETEGQGDVSWFNKRLAMLLRKERLADVLPTLFEDVDKQMVSWGKEGRINPFDQVYNLVFQMTVRMATCRELADDSESVQRLGDLYDTLEKNNTAISLLLPWLSRAKKNKEQATKDLYTTLYGYIEGRRNAKVPSADAFDVLIAEGERTEEIVGFALGVIFAGVINTRVNSCWILVYLATSPEWKAKVAEEINNLLAKHTDPSSSDKLYQRFSAVPISAWEDETPLLDLVVRETMRLAINGTALRRNVHQPVLVGGQKIAKGAFMAYPVGDVHLNPSIYTDPLKFDPARFGPGREEDRNATHAFLGWGAGRHPCTGMKVAKLEMKLIVALFLAGYDFELVDASGRYPEQIPVPDKNDIAEARPLGQPVFLKYRRTTE